MRRIRLVVVIAAMVAMSIASAAPAMAGVRFDDDPGDRFEDRIEHVEDYYEDRGIDVDEDYLWWLYVIDAFDVYYD